MSQSNVQKEGLVHRELSKAGEIIERESRVVYGLTDEAARSLAYLYPLKGMMYFVSHPQLFGAVRPVLYKSLVLSGVVVALMFLFTYVPQVALMALVSGPFALLLAIPAILTESYLIIKFLTKAFFLQKATGKMFDAILVQEGMEELVAKGRDMRFGNGGVKVLGKRLLQPIESRFSTEGVLRYILTLPLNAIPALGTAMFLVINGQSSGPSAHARYFQLKGFSASQREAFVEKRRGAYTAFGTVSLLLELIPVVGIVFGFSNTVGAALWAADLEREKGKGVGATSVQPEGATIRVDMGEL